MRTLGMHQRPTGTCSNGPSRCPGAAAVHQVASTCTTTPGRAAEQPLLLFTTPTPFCPSPEGEGLAAPAAAVGRLRLASQVLGGHKVHNLRSQGECGKLQCDTCIAHARHRPRRW